MVAEEASLGFWQAGGACKRYDESSANRNTQTPKTKANVAYRRRSIRMMTRTRRVRHTPPLARPLLLCQVFRLCTLMHQRPDAGLLATSSPWAASFSWQIPSDFRPAWLCPAPNELFWAPLPFEKKSGGWTFTAQGGLRIIWRTQEVNVAQWHRQTFRSRWTE